MLAASKVPTVPLLLREATEAMRVGEFMFRPGEAFAVDTEAAEMTFGFGPHVCPGADIGMRFAEATVRAAFDLGLVVDPESMVERRVRLHYGPARLMVRRS